MRLVEIKHITNNLDSKRIPLNSSQRAEKETNPMYPYIGANNIMAYIDEYIFDDKVLCIAEDGGSWGFMQTCAKIYNEKVWVNNHAHVLTAKEEVVLEYLMYYLNYTDLSLHINGATRGKLTKSSLNNIKVPLPPLEEQKKIAAILDAADDYRQKTKALIDKYDQLTQSLFLDMFGDPFTNPKGWRKASLGEIMVSKTGSVNPLEYPNELFEYFSIPAFDKGLAEMTLGSSIGSSKKHFQPGDVLLSRIVPHIRRCWIVPENNGYRQIGSGEWIVFKSGDVNPNFLRFYLTSDFFHSQFMKTIKGVGGSLMRADISQVRRLKFYTPPHDVQLEFNEMVLKIEKQKQQAEASLVKAEELFNSLLQRAFKGELTN